MNQPIREVLITSKVAKVWKDSFDKKVTELMLIVNKIDTRKQIQGASELLDIYHKSTETPAKPHSSKKIFDAEKPFQFFVFRN
jgi:hypothetical protein